MTKQQRSYVLLWFSSLGQNQKLVDSFYEIVDSYKKGHICLDILREMIDVFGLIHLSDDLLISLEKCFTLHHSLIIFIFLSDPGIFQERTYMFRHPSEEDRCISIDPSQWSYAAFSAYMFHFSSFSYNFYSVKNGYFIRIDYVFTCYMRRVKSNFWHVCILHIFFYFFDRQVFFLDKYI